MKPAEQWAGEWNTQQGADYENFALHQDFVKEIQLDAWKLGMTDAADIANKSEHVMHEHGCLTTMAKIYYAINQARDAKTTL